MKKVDELKHSILWRGIALPGHEACQLSWRDSKWYLEGTSVFSYAQTPCNLSYHIICDSAWRTLKVNVEGWLGNNKIYKRISTDPDQHWRLNEAEVPEVRGCVDVDLNFSPSTNLLPIRRLNLPVGESADIIAAWLKFPGFTLEPLKQRYTRLGKQLYRYESGNGQFVAELQIDREGFVIDYPGIWKAETALE